MATSTRASASSPASISPVGPPPAMTTSCFVMPTTVRHDAGLAASPRAWRILEVARDETTAALRRPTSEGQHRLDHRHPAIHAGGVGREGPAVRRLVDPCQLGREPQPLG